MSELNITDSLKSTAEDAIANVDVTVNVINDSTLDFKQVEVALKDTDTNTVKTVLMGFVQRKSTATKVQSMPGGVDFVIYKIIPERGDEVIGSGFADNVNEVNITITD